MGKAKAVYSELPITRESGTIACLLTETQRQAEEWKSFIAEKERALVGSCWLGEAGHKITKGPSILCD